MIQSIVTRKGVLPSLMFVCTPTSTPARMIAKVMVFWKSLESAMCLQMCAMWLFCVVLWCGVVWCGNIIATSDK